MLLLCQLGRGWKPPPWPFTRWGAKAIPLLCKTLLFIRVGCESWYWLCPLTCLLCVLTLLPDPAAVAQLVYLGVCSLPHPSPGGQAQAALSTSHTIFLLPTHLLPKSATLVPLLSCQLGLHQMSIKLQLKASSDPDCILAKLLPDLPSPLALQPFSGYTLSLCLPIACSWLSMLFI